jgi:hypothetical protein
VIETTNTADSPDKSAEVNARHGYYYAEITMPKTKREGLQNFVQLIINQIEQGEHREALLTAVDLLNDLKSKANPYAEVIGKK